MGKQLPTQKRSSFRIKQRCNQFFIQKVVFNSYISKEQAKNPSSITYQNDKPKKVSDPKYTLRARTAVKDKRMTI